MLTMWQIFDFIQVREGSGGTQRLLVKEKSDVRELLKAEAKKGGPDAGDYRVTYLYIDAVHRFLRIFLIKGRTPEQIIADAAYFIMFMTFWRRDLQQREGVSLTQNCLALQLCRDSLITCASVILSCKIFRVWSEHGRPVKVDFSHWSSRWSEYLFQVMQACWRIISCLALLHDVNMLLCLLKQAVRFIGHSVYSCFAVQKLRTYTRTSNKISAMQAPTIFRSICFRLLSPTIAGDVSQPRAKRGMPRGMDRVTSGWNEAPAGYWPSDQVRGCKESVHPCMAIAFMHVRH